MAKRRERDAAYKRADRKRNTLALTLVRELMSEPLPQRWGLADKSIREQRNIYGKRYVERHKDKVMKEKKRYARVRKDQIKAAYGALEQLGIEL